MNDTNIRELTCAITMQAVRDYFDPKVTPKKRAAILKDLRSSWMEAITNGTSVLVAEQLELNPEVIAERLRRHHEIATTEEL